MSVTVVAVEVAVRAGKIVRCAVGAPQTGEAKIDLQVRLARPADVVEREQIKIAVAIVIEKRRAGRPHVIAPGEAGRVGHFAKMPVLIVEQMVRFQRGKKQIIPAVTIIVANSNAHAVGFDSQPDLLADVLKVPAAVVAIQRLGRHAAVPGVVGPVSEVDQKKVLVAVVIVIQERCAAADGFRHEPLAIGAVDVGKANAGSLCHVAEVHRGRLSCRCRRLWRHDFNFRHRLRLLGLAG